MSKNQNPLVKHWTINSLVMNNSSRLLTSSMCRCFFLFCTCSVWSSCGSKTFRLHNSCSSTDASSDLILKTEGAFQWSSTVDFFFGFPVNIKRLHSERPEPENGLAHREWYNRWKILASNNRKQMIQKKTTHLPPLELFVALWNANVFGCFFIMTKYCTEKSRLMIFLGEPNPPPHKFHREIPTTHVVATNQRHPTAWLVEWCFQQRNATWPTPQPFQLEDSGAHQ